MRSFSTDARNFLVPVAAFDQDGNLLGVVGLNIFVDELGSLTELVTIALQSRSQSKTFDPRTVALTAADARIQVSSAIPKPFKFLMVIILMATHTGNLRASS